MKKLLLWAVLTVFLISCDKNDDGPAAQATSFLPKTTVGYSSDDNVTVNGVIEYDGNKITGISWDDDTHETYSYSNGKLVNTYYYWGSEVTTKKTFIYSGEKLSKLITEEVDQQSETVLEYTYNSNSTVAIKEFMRDLVDGDDVALELVSTGMLTLANGNITKFVRTYMGGATDTYTYSFDTMHNAYENVFASDILMMAELEGGKNNYLSYTFQSPEQQFSVACTNTYNTDGVLIKAIQTGSDNNTYHYETTSFINYTH